MLVTVEVKLGRRILAAVAIFPHPARTRRTRAPSLPACLQEAPKLAETGPKDGPLPNRKHATEAGWQQLRLQGAGRLESSFPAHLASQRVCDWSLVAAPGGAGRCAS